MRQILLLLLAGLVVLLSSAPVFGLEKVTLQLRWSHQFQFAGYYAAIEKGFYKEAGFDVTLAEGGVNVETVKEVMNGNAQYGVTNAELLIYKVQGFPVVALAAIFQHSPHVFLTRESSGIQTPHDFIGKVVKMSKGDRDIELHTMLVNEGVDLNKVHITEEQARKTDYLNPELDIIAAYITDQSYYFEQANIPYTVLAPITYGIDFYGDTLFTSQQQIDQDPDRVHAFKKASLLGWTYAMSHPEEIIDLLITKYGCTKDRDHLLSEAQQMQKLILPTMIELGHMNPGRWHHIGEVFSHNGTIPDDFSLEGFLFNPRQSGDKRFQQLSIGLLAILLFVFAITWTLFIFNRVLKKEIVEHEKTSRALQESQKQLSLNINQTEQFSLSAASILSIKDQKQLFASISEAIVNYSDFSRVLISLFNDTPPYRNLIGFAGVSKDIVEKVRKTELSKDCYKEVFEKGYRVGRFSYYIPYEMKHILKQEATIFGEGESTPNDDKWHPHDNLFVRMEDENGNFCGIISVDTSKSGLRPNDDIVRPLEIYASLISQIFFLRRTEENRDHLEAQLRQAQKMEAIGSLAGGVAHDFNNILSVIIGNVELALHIHPEQEEYVSHLQDIQQASIRAKDVVQHLLAFSRKAERGFKSIDIQKALQDSIKFLRSTLPSTISIEINLQVKDVCVIANNTQISQIILNICTNAAHAMEGIDGKLEIAATLEDGAITNKPAGDYVKLTITDNGHGISSKYLHQIYDPYFTTKDIGKGTGLGLAVVHGIISNHSGFIAAQSRPGCTVFTVHLPVSSQEIHKEALLSTKSEAPPVNGIGHIMVIDDNVELLKISSLQLKSLGYSVSSFSNSSKAYHHFAEHPENYDLVITDMTMPQLSGKVLIEKMLQVRPQLPTFICTGFSEKMNETLAKEIGAKQYFEKPLSIDTLAKAIKKELA